MIIGRYRITKRGNVVFGAFGIILLVLIGFVIKDLRVSKTPQTDSLSSVEQQESALTEGDVENTPSSEGSTEKQGLSIVDKNKLLETERELIYFMPDAYELDSSYYVKLDKVIDMANRFKDARIVIDGHYNGYPDFKVTEFWTSLAQNRAEMVEAYLISQGIVPGRIDIVNKGCSEPVNKDGSWQEIEKNRRVEIYFEPLKQ